jgi:hypothetical protein
MKRRRRWMDGWMDGWKGRKEGGKGRNEEMRKGRNEGKRRAYMNTIYTHICVHVQTQKYICKCCTY